MKATYWCKLTEEKIQEIPESIVEKLPFCIIKSYWKKCPNYIGGGGGSGPCIYYVTSYLGFLIPDKCYYGYDADANNILTDEDFEL